MNSPSLHSLAIDPDVDPLPDDSNDPMRRAFEAYQLQSIVIAFVAMLIIRRVFK